MTETGIWTPQTIADASAAAGTLLLAVAAFVQIGQSRQSSNEAEKLYAIQREDLEWRKELEAQNAKAVRAQLRGLVEALPVQFGGWMKSPASVPERDPVVEALASALSWPTLVRALDMEYQIVRAASFTAGTAFDEVRALAQRASPPPNWPNAVKNATASARLAADSARRSLSEPP